MIFGSMAEFSFSNRSHTSMGSPINTFPVSKLVDAWLSKLRSIPGQNTVVFFFFFVTRESTWLSALFGQFFYKVCCLLKKQYFVINTIIRGTGKDNFYISTRVKKGRKFARDIAQTPPFYLASFPPKRPQVSTKSAASSTTISTRS